MDKKLLIAFLPLVLILGGCSQSTPEAQTTTVVAKISLAPTIVADMETPISAAGSMGDASETLTYTYDVDGDGLFETKGSENFPATLYHTFTETGKHKVSVEVKDTKGVADIASQEFIVYPVDYLNVDKKSELDSIVTTVGKQVNIATNVTTDSKLTLRLYATGKTSLTAEQADIKDYGSWAVKQGTVDIHTITVDTLSPGEYNGTVSSDAGPEKDITVTIR